jgi:hypothetical protein
MPSSKAIKKYLGFFFGPFWAEGVILLLDLAGWPALPVGWWLCAVDRPTQKRP